MAIGHDNYKELVDNAGLDLLMYVSCWRGMYNNDWYGDELHGEKFQGLFAMLTIGISLLSSRPLKIQPIMNGIYQ